MITLAHAGVYLPCAFNFPPIKREGIYMSRLARLLKQHYYLKAEQPEDELTRCKRAQQMYCELDEIEGIYRDIFLMLDELSDRIDALILEYYYLIKFDDCRKILNDVRDQRPASPSHCRLNC